MSNKTGSPFHLPSPDEDLILTVSVGNTHLHWASHNGPNEDFNPKIFWRTPHIEEDDMGEDNLIQVLSRLIPDDAHDYIFGEETDASVEAAVRQSKLREVQEISIYVVSTNQAQAESLKKLLKTVPSKFCLLDDDMFFTEEQGRYSTMGSDRLATLAGAAYMHGHPALVFDGGTATTYSATDSAGNILGGGITPGIYTKLKSMVESTDALPDVSNKVPEKVSAALDQISGNVPIPTFARSTEDAMLGDIFQELALKGRNVIAKWLKKAYGNNTKPPKADLKLNMEKRVICTGGDADVLYLLLSPDSSGLIEMDERKSTLEYEVEVSKHLIHYGITAVLYNQGKLQEKNTNFTKTASDEHIGKRVAKVFDIEADDGDNIYRGTVKEHAGVDGFDGYRVLYDDGDNEDVSVNTLFEMFELYNTHGEKAKKTANTDKKKSKAVAGGDSPKFGQKKPEKKRPGKSASENGITSKAFVDDEKKAEKKKPSKQTHKKRASVNGGEVKAMVNDSSKTTNKKKAEARHQEPSENGVAAGSTTNVDDKTDGEKLAKPNAKKASVNGEGSKDSVAGLEEVDEEKAEKNKPTKQTQRKRASENNGAASAAKKAKLTQSYASMVKNSQPTVFIQRRVAKQFEDDEVYFGTITQYDESEPPPFWKVHYDDGDEEDYEKKDLIKALKLYDKEEGNDPSKKR